MLFSVCIPVYNTSKYLDECLQSVLCQTETDYEIVLVDDGSTDDSGKICDDYAVRYPHIRVIHKENEGLMLTRRRAFREAKGDWLICVDSDDYIANNHLSTIAETIRQYDCDMVMFDYMSFYPDGRVENSGIEIDTTQYYEGTGKQEIYKRRLLKNKYNNMWSKAIKRTVLDIDCDYSVFGVRNMCEDAIQSYALYTRAEKIVFVPKALYYYRRSIASITNNVNDDYWHAMRTSIDLGWQYVDMWKVSDEVACAYAARCVSCYCDFLSWLVGTTQLDEKKREAMFQSFFLENSMFQLAAKRYQPKYLATNYLKLRNPIIIESICLFRSWSIAKVMLKLENTLRKE